MPDVCFKKLPNISIRLQKVSLNSNQKLFFRLVCSTFSSSSSSSIASLLIVWNGNSECRLRNDNNRKRMSEWKSIVVSRWSCSWMRVYSLFDWNLRCARSRDEWQIWEFQIWSFPICLVRRHKYVWRQCPFLAAANLVGICAQNTPSAFN